jgi:N-acylglucosamine 2-epimerase
LVAAKAALCSVSPWWKRGKTLRHRDTENTEERTHRDYDTPECAQIDVKKTIPTSAEMKRRSFIGVTLSAAPLLAATSIPALGQAQRPNDVRNRRSVTLVGRSLGQLRQQYRNDLFRDFLPFMDKFVIDHEYGGFMCSADHLGKRIDESKSSWFEGRGTWVYAFLYNNLAREARHLDVAHRSVEFTLKSQPKGDELWPKGLSRVGAPVTSADGEIYGDLFIAEGLAEYSKATKDRAYWDIARQLVLKCLKLYDRADYRPTIGQTYLGRDAKPFPGARIQGVWMVLIRVLTQMLEMRADAELEKIAARCVDAIAKHHYNPELRLINELLNHDLSRPQNEYAQLVYTGHCLENLWMLLYEAARLRDERLFATFSEWFKRHVEVAWDDIYGGVFRNLQHAEKNVWLVDKVLWAQEEVLIGSMFILERTGADWAREWFDKMYGYVMEKYPLKRHGSPLWMYASDRKASFEGFQKMPQRVENFHHPRHLMLNLLSLERMIGKLH